MTPILVDSCAIIGLLAETSDWYEWSLPGEAAFLSRTAYRGYPQRGGQRRSPLPDILIGAHATTAGRALLTRDEGRYRADFPRLQRITPTTD